MSAKSKKTLFSSPDLTSSLTYRYPKRDRAENVHPALRTPKDQFHSLPTPSKDSLVKRQDPVPPLPEPRPVVLARKHFRRAPEPISPGDTDGEPNDREEEVEEEERDGETEGRGEVASCGKGSDVSYMGEEEMGG